MCITPFIFSIFLYIAYCHPVILSVAAFDCEINYIKHSVLDLSNMESYETVLSNVHIDMSHTHLIDHAENRDTIKYAGLLFCTSVTVW